ncbi:MAG: hypothetical protein LBU64_03510 [Planctomycetota bacterium]|nr:hypothetical protein [Planctomycetota bacterium]
MTDKIPPRLAPICGALALVCLLGAFSPSRTALESQTEGNRNDSIGYARQIVWDLFLLSNRKIRSRIITFVRNADLDHGLAQSLYSSPFTSPSVINSLVESPPPPQSLAVSNPTTRSPPA